MTERLKNNDSKKYKNIYMDRKSIFLEKNIFSHYIVTHSAVMKGHDKCRYCIFNLIFSLLMH